MNDTSIEICNVHTSRRYRITELSSKIVRIKDRIDNTEYAYTFNEFIECLKYFKVGHIMCTGVDMDCSEIYDSILKYENEGFDIYSESKFTINGLYDEINMLSVKCLFGIDVLKINGCRNGSVYLGQERLWVSLADIDGIAVEGGQTGTRIALDIGHGVNNMRLDIKEPYVTIDNSIAHGCTCFDLWGTGNMLNTDVLEVACCVSAKEFNHMIKDVTVADKFSATISSLDDAVDLRHIIPSVSTMYIKLERDAYAMYLSHGI